MKTSISLAGAVILTGVVAAVVGQEAPFKRTILQQGDISVPGREVITAVAEFQPGASPGAHTHAGEEIGYVLDGSVTVEQAGKPAVTLGSGQTFLIPAGTIHNARNGGSAAARILVTYVVEKGKPLATPAK